MARGRTQVLEVCYSTYYSKGLNTAWNELTVLNYKEENSFSHYIVIPVDILLTIKLSPYIITFNTFLYVQPIRNRFQCVSAKKRKLQKLQIKLILMCLMLTDSCNVTFSHTGTWSKSTCITVWPRWRGKEAPNKEPTKRFNLLMRYFWEQAGIKWPLIFHQLPPLFHTEIYLWKQTWNDILGGWDGRIGGPLRF